MFKYTLYAVMLVVILINPVLETTKNIVESEENFTELVADL